MARIASRARCLIAGWPLALRCLLAALCLHAAQPVLAQSAAEAAPSIIHMLDYVSVDYPEFVQDGKVLDEPEYQEQKEFAARSLALLERLPVKADKPALVAKAQRLLAAIEARAPGAEVSTLARQVAADVVRVYSVAVAPRRAPDLARAATLFQQHCASCHGAQGRGDGPAAQGMDPPASNFHDAARMRQRSPYGLYNTITLGVGGTPMRAFTELSDADRWALAFFAAGLRQRPDTLKRGEQLWQQGVGKAELGSLRQLVTAAPGDLAGDDLAAVQAHLLAHPEALEAGRPGALAFTRTRLQQALAAYQRGDREGARRDAITAYLEGFELVESSLDNVAPELRVATEREMMALRHAIDDGQPAQAVAGHVQRIDALIDEAEARLGEGGLSPQAAFTSSLLILVREGLEAILVLAAIIAFVRKTGRRDAMPWIHAGWIAAALLGAGTWVVSNHVLEITGASREMTEGVSALLAAAMLLYVGAWLHKRSHAQAWQSFIREQVTSALERRTLWAMAGIAFLAVYRELFEVILFYQALWAQAGPEGGQAVLGGMAAGAALLVVLAWVILRFGVRLPIGPFFALTSGLLVVMAVVFVGHGIAALQEAGVLGATPAGAISLPLLGIHPTAQGLLAQGVVVAAIAITWLAGRRRAASTA